MSRTSVALLASLLVATSACTYSEHDRHDDDWNPPPQQNDEILSATIDTGATLAEIEPGRGAGAFVEYTSGGQWRVYTACDTELSGYGCTWDIIVSVDPDNSIHDFEDDQLEASDYLDWEDQHAVRFVTSTTYDFDGFFVEATEGAPLRVDVYLDDQPAPRYIYWVGDGALHRGAPSNPIDLIPSSL
jgi:hypothetical protein